LSPTFDAISCNINACFSFKDHAALAQTQTKESNRREDVETTFQDIIWQQGSRAQAGNGQVQATPVTVSNFPNQFVPIDSSYFLRSPNPNPNENITYVTTPLDQNSIYIFAPKNINFGPINAPPLTPLNFGSLVYQNPSNHKYLSFNHNNC
jgi:hypothetical protein